MNQLRFTTTSQGFTLIELVVVIGIFTVMTGVVLAKYRTFDTNAKFANATEDIVLALRQAQVYGIGAKGTGASFTTPYGVYFNKDFPDQIILFADVYPPAVFPSIISGDGRYSSSDTLIQTISWDSPIAITDLQCNSSICTWSLASVTFKRPNPDAIITQGGADVADIIAVTIGNGTKSSIISITKTGQISVQ